MMKVEVEINDEVVDEIVLRELKLDYELNNSLEGDLELANALLTVIKYHTTGKEYREWIKTHSKGVEQICCDGGGPVTAGCLHDHCTGPKLVERK